MHKLVKQAFSQNQRFLKDLSKTVQSLPSLHVQEKTLWNFYSNFDVHHFTSEDMGILYDLRTADEEIQGLINLLHSKIIRTIASNIDIVKEKNDGNT